MDTRDALVTLDARHHNSEACLELVILKELVTVDLELVSSAKACHRHIPEKRAQGYSHGSARFFSGVRCEESCGLPHVA